jgi:hypothetical protein
MIEDCNAVRDPSECSMGSSSISLVISDFNDCCNNAGLSYIPGSGLRFTWNKSPGKPNGLLKKMDKAMGNLSLLNSYEGVHAQFLPYYTSDHSHVLVTFPGKRTWKPKPFKLLNYSTRKPQFLPTVKQAWDQNIWDALCSLWFLN